ncbi:PAQR family membrane homeostasis protein TrhA [Cellulomonas fengjieae]|uniref:Hemolysin III family protein n=1 Tax=Cellulomonas fengjieae TaxID=2819978 RepID=A0ABS3SLA2_9CELL|nr:hemolysin III family protein [Cellulomonas fengjieae]MBO3086497.1 hemolysin III family protein [Cellulomonas fengjieae]MBO3100493.1 hemolysin III family protein [Cellulomonas fengjieae]QVI66642.1 hemolysin III family protein [Cellulomonas fengjieae]
MSSSPAPAPGQQGSTPAAPSAVQGQTPGAGVAGDEESAGIVERVADTVKPHLRGWIHAGATPFVVVASIVLVMFSPTAQARWSTAVFGVTAVMLFGTSAVYHRGRWTPRTAAVLRRLDHTNIFLIIAGTYTPLAVLLLPPDTARTLLIVVWSGAVVGLLARVFWLGAPRWFYVPVYLALGWVAVWFFPDFYRSGGVAIISLIAGGGLAYTVGAIVYGTKRPNPSPRWFGFHEIFHVLTVIGYGCHYVAVSLAAYGSA